MRNLWRILMHLFRAVRHDWADEDAVHILTSIRDSMGRNSKIFIAELLMKTTVASDKFETAPYPLLANYGQAMNFAHTMDLNMMMMTNGKERSPTEFGNLVQAAGLVMTKIWECRGPLSIIECRIHSYSG